MFFNSCKLTKIVDENTAENDLTIITGDDRKVRCRRSIVAACSPILKGICERDVAEDRRSIIELLEMTEEGVRALLSYINSRDLNKPKEVCSVAMQLLNVAVKYDIPSLRFDIKTLFRGMPSSWWKLEIAFKMYFFSRKLWDGEVMKKKALEVLNSKFAADILQSDCYKQLIMEDPSAAVTFCSEVFGFKL